MKSFFVSLLFILVAQGLTAQNTTVQALMSQYGEDQRFTVVKITPKMFSLLAKLESSDPEYQSIEPILSKLTGLQILTTEDSIIDTKALYRDVLKRLPTGQYAELMTVRDGESNVNIWVKEEGDNITELLLVVSDVHEFALISLTGVIDLAEISKISKAVKVDGLEHLENVSQPIKN
jgi:Domain of unknown function (DUF4252)